MKTKKEMITFERKVSDTNSSFVIAMPIQLLAFLNVKGSDKVTMGGFKDKNGKYIAIWKKEVKNI